MKSVKMSGVANQVRSVAIAIAVLGCLISGSASQAYGQFQGYKGWAVGDSDGTQGTILYTKDGGTTWTSQTKGVPNVNINAISARGPLGPAWAVGDSGTILYFTGKKWTQKAIKGETRNFRALTFADSDHAWAVGDGGMIYYYNGGKWTPQTSGTKKNLNSVSFVKVKKPGEPVAYYGWAVGQYDSDQKRVTVILTEDGTNAKAWKNAASSPQTKDDAKGVAFVLGPPRTGTSVSLLGRVVGSAEFGIYTSKTAGNAWRAAALDAPRKEDINAIQALGKFNLWAVGAGPQSVLHYTDARDAWFSKTPAKFKGDETLYGLSFFPRAKGDVGWVVGQTGGKAKVALIYVTSDGGSSWKQQFLGNPKQKRLNGISIIAPSGSPVKLDGSTSPDTAAAGVNYVSVMASGFPEGNITAENVRVEVSDECHSAALAATSAVSVVSASSDSNLISFLLPSGLAPGQYFVSISDSEEGDANFESSNCSLVNVAQ